MTFQPNATQFSPPKFPAIDHFYVEKQKFFNEKKIQIKKSKKKKWKSKKKKKLREKEASFVPRHLCLHLVSVCESVWVCKGLNGINEATMKPVHLRADYQRNRSLNEDPWQQEEQTWVYHSVPTLFSPPPSPPSSCIHPLREAVIHPSILTSIFSV